MGMLVVPYDSNLSWNIYSSQTKEALRDHLPEGRPILGMYNNTTHGFLKEVYMAYCENKSNQTHYVSKQLSIGHSNLMSTTNESR